ncbi:MAG: penicillin-binding protein 2 [Clostridia bacterium]|nr:penicillin-binding protein 2 [Clostridia bacterium]
MVHTKRIAAFFAVMMIGFTLCAWGVENAQKTGQARQAVTQQSTWTLTADTQRGTIYDRHGTALTGSEPYTLTAIAPGEAAARSLAALPDSGEKQAVMGLFAGGKPFLYAFSGALPEENEGVLHIQGTRRTGPDTLAAHTLGLVDDTGHGVSGIEKACDDWLSENTGEWEIHYTVGASGRVLQGISPQITDTREQARAGVWLTLDADLQRLCEEAASPLKSGAAVLLDVETGEILALCSSPRMGTGTEEEASYLNKAISAYSVGSVFKMVSAAAALENGVDPTLVYECRGAIEVDGVLFHCFDGTAHGAVTMEQAFAVSCNGYFVKAMEEVPVTRFRLLAEVMGLGRAMELADGYWTASGQLPREETLLQPANLANFSFGQGELTATPLQIAAVTAAVAGGGIYRTPVLLYGYCDAEKEIFQRQALSKPEQVMSEETAGQIAAMMKKAVESGTAKNGAPQRTTAAAKTGTAQTGRYQGGEEEVVCWYTGFFPAENPRFALTVMQDGVTENQGACAQVFAEIADGTLSLLSDRAGN